MFVYFVPILCTAIVSLGFLGLAYRQLRINTFKQTDLRLATQSIVSSLVLLPFACASSALMFMLVVTSSSIAATQHSTVYEWLYVVVVSALAALAFVLLVLANRNVRASALKLWRKIFAAHAEHTQRRGQPKKDEQQKRSSAAATKTTAEIPFDGFIGTTTAKPKQIVPSDFIDVNAEINAVRKFIGNLYHLNPYYCSKI